MAPTYVERMACAPPALVDPDDGNRTLPTGSTWTCPDCGALWYVRAFVNWGGVVDVQWYCSLPPGAVNPTQERLSALEARAAAAESRDADLQTHTAALDARAAALEARTVTVHRALVTVTAIAVGKSIDVTAKWLTPFPDTTYDVEVVTPAALIGKVTWTQKSKTKAEVVLTIANTTALVIVAGSILDVTATRMGAPA